MRRAGILLPVSSLPGTLGIGDFGSSAYEWIDKLHTTKANLWQILPLNPVGYGNSPYQTYSSFAGDEIYISIEKLYKMIKIPFERRHILSSSVDYDVVRKRKEKYLKEAFKHFKPQEDYAEFIKTTDWLDEYVEFITLKKMNKMKSWTKWTIHKPDAKMMEYERFVQYVFFKQWFEIKDYANQLGIDIVGDLPIYLGHDSAEVYFQPDLFYLNKDGTPKLVAGVPPDYFSDEGQLWGNPIYRWDLMETNNYKFWADRLRWNQKMFDVIRLDHFRAFDTYWVVDGQATTAKKGEWKLGPSNKFFDSMYDQIPYLNLVVEDLGDLRPEVLELRDDYDLMGMKIIQFALKNHEIKDNKTLDENLLVFTGTHDNMPIQAVIDEVLTEKHQDHLMETLPEFSEDLFEVITNYTLSLNPNWAILPIQDVLGYGKSSQINSPGTIGSPNWEWKLYDFEMTNKKMPVFKRMVQKNQRD